VLRPIDIVERENSKPHQLSRSPRNGGIAETTYHAELSSHEAEHRARASPGWRVSRRMSLGMTENT
jgi:hypothetical protein